MLHQNISFCESFLFLFAHISLIDHEYSPDLDVLTWTPDLYHRASIADALCKKLEEIIIQKYNHELKKAS